MQRMRHVQHLLYDEAVTPWNQQDSNLFALTTLKNRNASLPTKLELKNKSQPNIYHTFFNKYLYKKQQIRNKQPIITRAHTIQFQVQPHHTNTARQKHKSHKQLHFRSPLSLRNPRIKTKEDEFLMQRKKKQRKQRSNSYQTYKSKYNKDFSQIESIKIKQLVIRTNKDFFRPMKSRSKQKFSNRVSEMLSIIRKAMHKEGPIAKLIKKSNRPRLKSQMQLQQIVSKR